jgi:hypothetical protein
MGKRSVPILVCLFSFLGAVAIIAIWLKSRDDPPRVSLECVGWQQQSAIPIVWFKLRNRSNTPLFYRGIRFAGADYSDYEVPVTATELVEPIPAGGEKEVRALWIQHSLPQLASVYLVPWSSQEEQQSRQRYARLPKFIRDFFLRKYDERAEKYRNNVRIHGGMRP